MPGVQSLRPRTLGLLLVALALVTLGTTGLVQAQDAASFEESTLKSFAAAMVKVEEVRNVYAPQIENASSVEAAQRLQQEANGLMVQAVQDQGLEVAIYNEIAQAMQRNGELRKQIMEMVEDVRG
jgi:GTP1/Obg family GTP-binding protein